jgi:hypothetical protein
MVASIQASLRMVSTSEPQLFQPHKIENHLRQLAPRMTGSERGARQFTQVDPHLLGPQVVTGDHAVQVGLIVGIPHGPRL